MDLKMKDAVRTVGQLLLHRPTTGTFADDCEGNPVLADSKEAYCFCFLGAILAVSDKLHVNVADLGSLCSSISGCTGMYAWDTGRMSAQKLYALKLADYQ